MKHVRGVSFLLVLLVGVAFTAACSYQRGGEPPVETKAVPAPSIQYLPVPAAPLPDGTEGQPLSSPRVLYLDEPIYPDVARQTGLEGKVLVELLIDPTGVVTETRVVETTSPIFNRAAEQAARRSRFDPGRIGDRPIAFRWPIPFEFYLVPPETQDAGGTGPATGDWKTVKPTPPPPTPKPQQP